MKAKELEEKIGDEMIGVAKLQWFDGKRSTKMIVEERVSCMKREDRERRVIWKREGRVTDNYDFSLLKCIWKISIGSKWSKMGYNYNYLFWWNVKFIDLRGKNIYKLGLKVGNLNYTK